MRLAIKQALKAAGKTHPNPAVGAVVSKAGRILSVGHHRGAGQPHAEVEAIRALPQARDACGATLHVTLEPCSTSGRTPPCTDAIIAAGISRVVFGAPDPNPANSGKATAILRAAGIDTACGVLARECAEINEGWNKWISTGLPFVIAKAGMTLDANIGSPPGSRWITSEAARLDAMRLRATCGAILVGAGTIRVDDPSLTVRGIDVPIQALRVVWSPSGDIPACSRILSDAHRDRTRVARDPSLRGVLAGLARDGIERVLIEGGSATLGEAFDDRLVDRLVFYIAPMLTGMNLPVVGGKGAGSNDEGTRLENTSYRLVGGDLRVEGSPVYPRKRRK